jgi:hypothetical protein
MKVSPVAVPAFPTVGDQSTEILVSSPELPEVTDLVKAIMQEELTGAMLKIGRVIALFVPPMV